MPLRLHQVKPSPSPSQQVSTASAADVCGAAAALSMRELRQHHDSGSDSGTELVEEQQQPGAPGDSSCDSDIPQELFDLLEKTFSVILCRQQDDSDLNRVVLHFFRLIERRCLRRDAFTQQHRLRFSTWLKRMDQVWEITKGGAEAASVAAAEAKRKFDRR